MNALARLLAVVSLLLACIVGINGNVALGDDGLIDQLIDPGIEFGDGSLHPVQKPLDWETPPHVDALAGRLSWDRMVRDSVVAPVWMDLDYVKDESGQRIGHHVHFRFVVHVPLATLRDRDLMRDLFSDVDADDSDGDFVDLETEALSKAGIDALPGRHYGLANVPLMNQVVVRGIIEAESNSNHDTYLMIWRLKPLDSASPYASVWTPVQRNAVGKRVVGDPEPYRGAGGYLQLMSLATLDDQPVDACLVEGRFLLYEPEGWFGGSNFLRSKFPLLIQEAARKFRRQIAKK
ncbi:hypothetical protein [Crateriforma spongiae]|uniref:hypothetical protein n=1 Tax=Crateriforma spongiae TaxID=2724528 RepID=UPI0039AF6253